MEWSHKDVLKLISLYRLNECLWNYRNQEYKSLERKRTSWAQISKVLGKDVDDLKRKIKHLRTAYLAEKKKVDASKINATSQDELYESNLFYYDELRFLDSFIVLRKMEIEKNFNDVQEATPKRQWDTTDYHETKIDEKDFQEEYQRSIPEEYNCVTSAPQSRSPSPFSSTAIEEVYIPPPKRSRRSQNGPSNHKKSIETCMSSTTATTPVRESIYSYFTKGLALQLQQLPVMDATETMNEIHTLVTRKLLKFLANQNGEDDGDMLHVDLKYV